MRNIFLSSITYIFITTLGVTLAMISAGCGSDGESNLNDTQLNQDVRNISYALSSGDLGLKIGYVAGGGQELRNALDYAPNQSKDQIRKVIDGSKFVLIVNGVQAAINISPDGQMKYQQDINQSEQGCELKGSSSISGTANNKKLELDWSLKLNIDGEACSEQLKAQFTNFLSDELNRLNILAAKDLFNSLDQSTTASKSVELTLRVRGDGN